MYVPRATPIFTMGFPLISPPSFQPMYMKARATRISMGVMPWTVKLCLSRGTLCLTAHYFSD